MRARRFHPPSLVFCLAAAISLPAAAQEPAPLIESIRADQLRADLFFLAGDALRGRLTDTHENVIAGEWIASRFQRLGLLAPVSGSYIQPYNLMTATLGTGNRLAVRGTGGVVLEPLAGQSYYPHRFSANGSAAGPLLFVGYGISSSAHDHDDYGSTAVRGAVVLALDHEPGEADPESPFDGVVTSPALEPTRESTGSPGRGGRWHLVRTGRAQPRRSYELRGTGAGLLALRSAPRRALYPERLVRPRTHPGHADLTCAGRAARRLHGAEPRRVGPYSRAGTRRRHAAAGRGGHGRDDGLGRAACRARQERGGADRGFGPRAQGRMDHHFGTPRPQRERRAPGLQRGRRRRIGNRGPARDRRGICGGRRGRATAQEVRCSSLPGTRRKGGFSGRGRIRRGPSIRWSARLRC